MGDGSAAASLYQTCLGPSTHLVSDEVNGLIQAGPRHGANAKGDAVRAEALPQRAHVARQQQAHG